MATPPSTLQTLDRARRIRRHSPLAVALRMPLAGAWVGVRFALAPLLWLAYRSGARMDLAYQLDSFLKRQLFPLTERPDEVLRRDLATPLMDESGGEREGGESRPSAWPQLKTAALDLQKHAQGRPLLLVLYRGRWCPYSRLHLTDLSQVVESLERMGVAVLAVSTHKHEPWWRSHGVAMPFAADPEGELFRAMGVRIEPNFAQQAWGLLLPHESVFLFDSEGELVMADVRRLNSTKTGQTFLAGTLWLEHARALVQLDRPARGRRQCRPPSAEVSVEVSAR